MPRSFASLVRVVSRFQIVWLALWLATLPAVAGAAETDAIAWFETKIRPLLAERCYECHGEAKQKGGLRLDSAAALQKGGESGALIVPGDPEASLLISAVRYQDDGPQMPPTRRLAPEEVAALEKWVKLGAPGSQAKAAAATQTATVARRKNWLEIFEARRQWWNLQPVRSLEPPHVADADWVQSPVDAFLRQRMDRDGLAPSPLADRRTLIRRASLVLTGLPPSASEVERYVQAAAQNPPAAFEALVDRLLASPHFGERFARHWLDVVHFSETNGCEFNYDVPFAWRYRDYVIRAFNDDLAYDRFVREQIAGDLLAEPRWNARDRFNESAIGTAFYRFGEVSQQSCVEFPVVGYDIADGQLDTLTKAFQATTVACARCHDHKLDAISTKDYYALLGILRSSRSVQRTLDAPEVNRDAMADLASLKQEIRRELATIWLAEVRALDAAKLSQLAANKASSDPLADPLGVWRKIAASEQPADDWRKLATEYAQQSAKRREFNQKNFTTLADFRDGTPAGWTSDGHGLRNGAGASGDFVVAKDGDSAVSAVLPAGVFTFSLSEKLNGALRSPTLRRTHANVSFQILGGHNSLARLVFNNGQLGGHQKSLHHDQWTWVTVPFPGNTDQLFPYAELVTFWDNPKFPEPQGDADKASGVQRGPWSEHAKNPRTWWGVRRVVLHNANQTPQDELSWLARLHVGAAPAGLDEAAARYATITEQAVQAFAENRATDDDVCWLNWLLTNGLASNRSDASVRLGQLIARYREVEANRLALPRTMPGLADEGPGFDQPLFVRGDLNKPGEAVQRRYLEALASSGQTFDKAGSGRAALAEAIANPDNPLTARVMVNRVWQWVFGAGLVRSPDDFGHLGEQPSHPELLDYLAQQFVAEGWSVKKLVRAIVLTRAFQLDGAPQPQARQRDPQNVALSHYSARRQEAEVIRDNILAVCGRLDRTLYGPSIHPYRQTTDSSMRLFAGPLDGDGRRSIYLKVQLMEAMRFLSAFNLPGGKVTQGRRDTSNVPAQSLALLNDPFVRAMADRWARRLIEDGSPDVATRVDAMFLAALGRPAMADERKRFCGAVNNFAALHKVDAGNALTSQAVWKDAAHAMFNFKEFIFIP